MTPQRRVRFIQGHYPNEEPWPGRYDVRPHIATSVTSSSSQRIFDVGLDITTPFRLHHWNLRWWGKRR